MRFLSTRRKPLPARGPHGDRGFMMVAILIGMGVAAIMMTAAVPKWIQQVQRTREEELIFRGEQYARALALYAVKVIESKSGAGLEVVGLSEETEHGIGQPNEQHQCNDNAEDDIRESTQLTKQNNCPVGRGET